MVKSTKSRSRLPRQQTDCDADQRARPCSSADIHFASSEQESVNANSNTTSSNNPDTVEIDPHEEEDDDSSSDNLTPTFSRESIVNSYGDEVDEIDDIDDSLKESTWAAYTLRDKSLRYRLHKETLEEYLSQNLTPKGLQIKKRPGVDFKSEEFSKEWNAILTQTSQQLMGLLIKQYDKQISILKEEIAEKDKEIDDTLSTEDKEDYMKEVTDLLSDKEQELLLRRKRKLQRDKIMDDKAKTTTALVLKRHLQSKLGTNQKRKTQSKPKKTRKARERPH